MDYSKFPWYEREFFWGDWSGKDAAYQAAKAEYAALCAELGATDKPSALKQLDPAYPALTSQISPYGGFIFLGSKSYPPHADANKCFRVRVQSVNYHTQGTSRVRP